MVKKIVSLALLLICAAIGIAQAETVQSSTGCHPRSTTVIGMALNLNATAGILPDPFDLYKPAGTSNYSSSINIYFTPPNIRSSINFLEAFHPIP